MEDTFARAYVQSHLRSRQSPLRIAFLGGSLTNGESVKKKDSFVSLVEQQISSVVGREVIVLRYGQSGTMSSNALYKLPELIAEKPDLVFVDYAMNDPGDLYLWESTEGIAYQLLEQEIGVVFLLFCNENGRCTRGATEKVGRYYQVPVYDIGQYIYGKVQSGKLSWQEYAQDYVHPTADGHKMIAGYLLNLFSDTIDGEPGEYGGLSEPPDEPCFEGAFRKTEIKAMNEELQEARPGDVVFDGEIETRMILVETWQDSIPNAASLVFALDGRTVYCAEAYASMAWGNPVCHYLGGDGTLEKHHLTVKIGKGAPPKEWNFSEFRLRLLLGQ